MVLHSKLRSWLTIVGIVIGVAAIIAIVSIGEGLQQQVASQLSELDGDVLTISPGASRGSRFGWGHGRGGGSSSATDEEVVLDRTDLQALKGLTDIKVIDTNIRGNADVYYLSKQGSVSVTGVDPAVWAQVSTRDLTAGRLLGPADTNVIVIGGRLADGFFDSNLGVNQMITIEEKPYRIVGILDDTSTSVYMPIQSAYDILDDKERNVYDTFVVKIKNEDELDLAMANIDKKLKIIRHVSERDKDFTISSNRAQQERRAEITGSMTVFLTAIAAVALLVGAVGIANTMFTSVLEKTKQIGIMKAIGARNKDIMIIFLLNAALIGLIGGILGVLLGYLLSSALPALMSGGGGITGRFASAGSIITMKSVVWALGLSVMVGVLSGAVPAYQASKLKPVDALRYE